MREILKIFLVLIVIMQVLCACSDKTDDEMYSGAIQNVCFSAENDCFCFALSKQKSVILEKDNVITDLYDYSYSDDFHGMKNPFIYNEKLYYVTSSHQDTVCIACFDMNNLGQADVLTPEKDNIYAFTVTGNRIYYYAYHNGENAIYSFDLKSKKEDLIFSTDDYIYNFFVSEKSIIYGNTKYDFNKEQEYELTAELSDKNVAGLGIIDNIYYCSFMNSDMTENEIYSVNLRDNTVKSVCELPVGFNEPRLYDNKILYVDSNENDSRYLLLGYYDLSTNKMKTAFDRTSDCYSYDLLYDYMDNYDSFYYGDSFYMWYPDTIVKINNLNEEKIFGLKSYVTDSGSFSYQYSWMTYEEYLKEND